MGVVPVRPKLHSLPISSWGRSPLRCPVAILSVFPRRGARRIGVAVALTTGSYLVFYLAWVVVGPVDRRRAVVAFPMLEPVLPF